MATDKKPIRVITTPDGDVLAKMDDDIRTGAYASRAHWMKQASRAYCDSKKNGRAKK